MGPVGPRIRVDCCCSTLIDIWYLLTNCLFLFSRCLLLELDALMMEILSKYVTSHAETLGWRYLRHFFHMECKKKKKKIFEWNHILIPVLDLMRVFAYLVSLMLQLQCEYKNLTRLLDTFIYIWRQPEISKIFLISSCNVETYNCLFCFRAARGREKT